MGVTTSREEKQRVIVGNVQGAAETPGLIAEMEATADPDIGRVVTAGSSPSGGQRLTVLLVLLGQQPTQPDLTPAITLPGGAGTTPQVLLPLISPMEPTDEGVDSIVSVGGNPSATFGEQIKAPMRFLGDQVVKCHVDVEEASGAPGDTLDSIRVITRRFTPTGIIVIDDTTWVIGAPFIPFTGVRRSFSLAISIPAGTVDFDAGDILVVSVFLTGSGPTRDLRLHFTRGLNEFHYAFNAVV
ncbi:MAG: hypothetical protein ACE5JI_17735 [Acidobacteriota bacterium]